MRTYGLRFDVNCSILLTELPLLERPADVAGHAIGSAADKVEHGVGRRVP